MTSKILSILCILSLCVEAVIEIQHFFLDASFDCFSLIWVIRCFVILFLVVSAVALFIETINVNIRYLPRKSWLVLVWLIAFIVWCQMLCSPN